MNLKQIAQKLGGYIQSKTQDDEGWVRQNKFTPSKQVQQMGQNLNTWGNIAKQGINNQIDIQKKDFNQFLWQPLKQNPVLTHSLNRFEQATPAIGNQLKQLNPFAQKQTPQQNWQDTKKIGAAALTAYGLAKAPLSAVLGGAIINPLIKLGTNVYENKKGADLNKQLSQYGQSRTDIPLFAQPKPYQQKKINEGVVDSIFEGAGQGLANAGTTKLTNSLVGYFSSSVPFLNKLTEKSIASGVPVATDTIKEATKKFFKTAGKRLIKAAVLETAVESPIWATFTQSEQETYLEALQREAIQNLQMNVGMAGVQSLGDARSLIPIVKNSVDTAVNNYFKNISSPESLKRQAGYIDFMGNVVDGTDRTNRFNNLVDAYYSTKSTPQQKIESLAEIKRLATDVFGNKKIQSLSIGLNEDPENLIMALSDVLNKDIPNNTGYQEPFTLRNLLGNKELQRGGMDLTDKTKGFPQTPSSHIKTGGVSPLSPESKGTIKLKDNDLVKTFDETIKTTETPKVKVRGFTESVQEAPKITKGTKVKVTGEYEVKPTEQLMGEAKALLTEGGSIKDVNKVQNIDAKITATIQEAINLDRIGKHKEAAALFNNLSTTGTELGRGVHAFSLLNQMSPEAITLSAVGRIKKYNETAKVKIPELTGEQQKMISDSVRRIQSITDERTKNIELNKLQEQISSFIPSTFVDKLITTWKAGLLTSPRTTLRNITGNTIMQGGEITSSQPSSFADYLMSLKTGQRTTTGRLQGTLSGAKTGVSSAVDIMKYGFDPSESISKFDTKKITWGNNPVEQALKKYTDFVFNSLSAQDKPFWNSSYARSLYDQASAIAINQGNKGNKAIIENLVKNATEEMKVIATNDANYATFKDKNMISNVAAGFKRSAGEKWYTKLPAEIVAPFTGVPSSMVAKTFDYSPLGLLRGIKDAGKVITQNVPDLQRQAAQEIGRGTVGTGIFALGSYLMAKGLMTGQPKDDAERKQWELEGKQQNSILINGKWRSINSVGPQTLILLAGAKFDEEMNDPEGSMAKYGLTLVQDQLGQTFLSGVQQPLQAITDPNRYGKSYVGGQVASFVPNIVKDTSKALDPLARETDTGSFTGNIKTSVQSGIPIWRNQMTPKRDVLGNEIKQEPTGLGAYIDLFNSKTPISNNVVDELSRLNNAGYNATPSKLSSTQTIKGVKGKLNQQELDVLETKTGIAVSNGLDTLFKSNSYQKLDDEAKQKAIDDLVSKTRKQVRSTIDLTVMPDLGYTTSKDSPKGLGRVGLYGKSLVTDPGQTLKAVIAGNPIRKVEGGAVILERKNALGTLDAGDKTTEVDHIIALSLGGTNDKSNLQVLPKSENRIKGQVEVYLLGEMKAGRITKKEAQERDKNWRNEIDNLPKNVKEKLVAELSTDTSDTGTTGDTYQIINEDTGNITTIDLSKPIEEPEYTGFDELDKKLKSSYKSAITTRISNITKLYKDGQITAEKANKLISELKIKSGTGTKKKSKKKITFKVTSPKALPKITLKISSPVSRVKLKSAPKIKLSKTDNRKYTIKA